MGGARPLEAGAGLPIPEASGHREDLMGGGEAGSCQWEEGRQFWRQGLACRLPATKRRRKSDRGAGHLQVGAARGQRGAPLACHMDSLPRDLVGAAATVGLGLGFSRAPVWSLCFLLKFTLSQ